MEGAWLDEGGSEEDTGGVDEDEGGVVADITVEDGADDEGELVSGVVDSEVVVLS